MEQEVRMTTLEEMSDRLTALEKRAKANEDAAGKSADIHSAVMEAIVELTGRIAALELTVKYNARATERGFLEVNTRLDRVESDIAALRRDLPGMLVAAIREAPEKGGAEQQTEGKE
jgi:predicted  nucleic acid-binding Zn-ribbon protein